MIHYPDERIAARIDLALELADLREWAITGPHYLLGEAMRQSALHEHFAIPSPPWWMCDEGARRQGMDRDAKVMLQAGVGIGRPGPCWHMTTEVGKR